MKNKVTSFLAICLVLTGLFAGVANANLAWTQTSKYYQAAHVFVEGYFTNEYKDKEIVALNYFDAQLVFWDVDGNKVNDIVARSNGPINLGLFPGEQSQVLTFSFPCTAGIEFDEWALTKKSYNFSYKVAAPETASARYKRLKKLQ
ncbi:MAG: hypothetical protein RSC56_04385 [Acidaminococcaceae bacterium]